MAGIVSNIKNNIMLGQADYLFRKAFIEQLDW